MPNISFASGGDSDMSEFVAYVAKDSTRGRACYVLDCWGGRAQEVISTIGQAFELRFKEFLKRSPRPEPARIADADRDYYNDLPGKLSSDQISDETDHRIECPPRLPAGKVPPDGEQSASSDHVRPVLSSPHPTAANLIDLNTGSDTTAREEREEREYVNCDPAAASLRPDSSVSLVKDPFDMRELPSPPLPILTHPLSRAFQLDAAAVV